MGQRRERLDGPWRGVAARLSAEIGADRGGQKTLAYRIGVSEATMSRFLAGTHQPRADELHRLASALGTTTSVLLGEREPPPPIPDPRLRGTSQELNELAARLRTLAAKLEDQPNGVRLFPLADEPIPPPHREPEAE